MKENTAVDVLMLALDKLAEYLIPIIILVAIVIISYLINKKL
jgi:hypothetical protein